MEFNYNGDSDATVIQKINSLVDGCIVGKAFRTSLDEISFQLQFTAKNVTKGGTYYEGGKHGGTLNVNLTVLESLPIGKQAATILHELFHCLHRNLDPESFRFRNTSDGVVGKGVGGWVEAGNAEEQFTITGYLREVGSPSPKLKEWALKGLCENKILEEYGLPLRNSHGSS